MKLSDGETIVTAWAESASGPGWSNSPLWVLVRSADGRLRVDCIQPDKHTRDMATLYRVSQEAHLAMTRAVRTAAEKKGKPR